MKIWSFLIVDSPRSCRNFFAGLFLLENILYIYPKLKTANAHTKVFLLALTAIRRGLHYFITLNN